MRLPTSQVKRKMRRCGTKMGLVQHWAGLLDSHGSEQMLYQKLARLDRDPNSSGCNCSVMR